jgi:hypothetical protein
MMTGGDKWSIARPSKILRIFLFTASLLLETGRNPGRRARLLARDGQALC